MNTKSIQTINMNSRNIRVHYKTLEKMRGSVIKTIKERNKQLKDTKLSDDFILNWIIDSYLE